MSKSLNANFSGPFKVGAYENYLNALLADLQNSVPGGQQNPLNHLSHAYTGQNGNASSGYGSLRSRPTPQATSPYQEVRRVITTDQKSAPGSQYSQTNTHYNNQNGTGTAGNLSELDTLLQDLSQARYGANLKPVKSSLGSQNELNDSIKRPSVDDLLEELSNAQASGPVYAVPSRFGSSKSPGGKHVTITVRETKTERMTPVNQSGHPGDQEVIQKVIQHSNSAVPHASTATRELDDLMASLSDFKINSSAHQQQTVTEYAKPNQGISYSHQETTIHHNDQLDSMLGSLQENMNRQGVTTTQKGCCSACDKPIVGQVITALGRTWHPEHFTCSHCCQELGTRNFFERDGAPYCEPDYHNLFSPRCAYCNGAILDKCVTALDKTWHTEHFFCAQCGQQFGEDGFHERDGKAYCRNDYFDMFAPKCSGCNRAIMENYISALNAQWHAECFVCRDCRQPFQNGSFFDHEGLPYCETHYHAKRGSLCAGCSKPITGRCITAMFRKFHPEHFVCAFCLKQLNKGTFKEQNDKPYCHECFDKLFS
ncbi:leupaxin isoform X2 [Sitodiplosis mosellana]|uniref:leupaxin isoform X2 n=1 Tax=Sitodiplosis mosellana TaxID=263140 RepID=UPI002443DC6D|nr:leupaxin isoform X2 [Sitodiplosis mosellana]XP_055304568.1 leupaxin isoform X2 [Sitodiplosis mosellana]XP_055304570.1 leupaxin isoform X2 [Sitodiplosis mosellana]XP_055304571.1 leupaxin isoform X2 [Sitodiplosis mosellana]